MDQLPPVSDTILDGYGKPFNPRTHADYVMLGVRTCLFSTYTDPCNTGYIDPDRPLKDKPAGHFEKGSGV